MKRLLSAISLGDSYEINARVLPGMLCVLPVTILAILTGWEQGERIASVGLGAGLEVVLAVVFGKIGHSLGSQLERNLIATWGGLPTTRWLRPSDTTHSAQMKSKWRSALCMLSGLDIDAAISSDDPEEIDRVIADAVLTVRNDYRYHEEAKLLRKHNMAYGFAKNAAGLRWMTPILSGGSFGGAVVLCYFGQIALAAPLIEGLFFIISLAFAWQGPAYVRHTAERYAQSFFTSAIRIAEAHGSPQRT